MHGFARVLDDRVALDQAAAGFHVNFHVTNVGAEGNTSPIRHDFRVAGNRSTGSARTCRQILQCQGFEIAIFLTFRRSFAVFPNHIFDRNFPGLGGAFTQIGDGFAGRINGRHGR